MKHARPVFPLLAAVLLSGVLVMTASAAFGPIILVSHTLPDQPAVEQSLAPAISADGRYTVYSWTSSIAPEGSRTDIYLYDRDTGSNQMISRTPAGGEPDGDSTYPKISADGRWVAFLSEATNLPEGDNTSDPDIYILDRDTDTDGIFDESGWTALEFIDIVDPGATEEIPAPFFSMSADGQQFAYNQYRTNLISDIYLLDRRDPVPGLINITEDADGSSTRPILSPSGRYVAFSSQAIDLVLEDTNGHPDVFLYDRGTSSITRISVSDTGEEGDNQSGIDVFSNFSADEEWVWFYSDASNLIPGKQNDQRGTFFYSIQAGMLYRVQELIGEDLPDHQYVGAGMLTGGRWLFYSDWDLVKNRSPFYAYHTVTRQKLLVNERLLDGQAAELPVDASAFSKDGGWVAFESNADDLVLEDLHFGADIFLRELGINQFRDVFLPVLFGQ